MSEGLNRVMLFGNLGADPELRTTQAGDAVLKLRLATTERYLDRNKAWQERTEWHSVVVWGKRGEALHRILAKGSTVFVEGSLRTSSYDDKEGIKRYKTDVIAQKLLLAGGRGAPRMGGDEPDPGGAPAGHHARPPTAARPAAASGGPPAAATAVRPAEDNPPDDFEGGFGGSDDDIPFLALTGGRWFRWWRDRNGLAWRGDDRRGTEEPKGDAARHRQAEGDQGVGDRSALDGSPSRSVDQGARSMARDRARLTTGPDRWPGIGLG